MSTFKPIFPQGSALPESVSVVPNPPAGDTGYGLGALALFKEHNRLTLPQAPVFDPSKDVKLWYDSAALGNQDYVYETNEVRNGAVGRVSKRISADVARSVNIPGRKAFEPWIPAPTKATRVFGTGEPQPINPRELATKGQAEALNVELGGKGIKEITGAERLAFKYPVEEGRRVYVVIDSAGREQNAGNLLEARFRYGVDFPGQWDYAEAGNPTWVPDNLGDGQPSAAQGWIPVPMRPVNFNTEQAVVTLMGVATISKITAPVLTSSDASLARIERKVTDIQDRLTKIGI